MSPAMHSDSGTGGLDELAALAQRISQTSRSATPTAWIPDWAFQSSRPQSPMPALGPSSFATPSSAAPSPTQQRPIGLVPAAAAAPLGTPRPSATPRPNDFIPAAAPSPATPWPTPPSSPHQAVATRPHSATASARRRGRHAAKPSAASTPTYASVMGVKRQARSPPEPHGPASPGRSRAPSLGASARRRGGVVAMDLSDDDDDREPPLHAWRPRAALVIEAPPGAPRPAKRQNFVPAPPPEPAENAGVAAPQHCLPVLAPVQPPPPCVRCPHCAPQNPPPVLAPLLAPWGSLERSNSIESILGAHTLLGLNELFPSNQPVPAIPID